MIELRPYQVEAVDRIRAAFAAGWRRVLFVLPTGGGKTITFAFVAASAAQRGKRVVLLAHRIELVEQISSALAAMNVAHGVIAPGHPAADTAVQVASIPTLARRLAVMEPFDLVVVDEAHHAVAGSWRRILDAMPAAFVLGVSATPERLDGRGLGDVFNALVEGPSVAELTAAGYLMPARAFAPSDRLDLSAVRTRAGDYEAAALARVMSRPLVISAAVEAYRSLADGREAVAFCAGIEHSRLVAERFAAAGIRAAHVDGDTPAEERRNLIAALGDGRLDVLSNAGLISEGVDVPAIGAALLLRPTQSLAVHLQQCGRALRPAPGKTDALLIDLAGNTIQHGLPDAPRRWSLAGRPKGEPSRAGLQRLRPCPFCKFVQAASAYACAACGKQLRQPPVEVGPDELHELPRPELVRRLRQMPYHLVEAWADTAARLRLVAEARGYRSEWIAHRLRELGRESSLRMPA